MSISWTYSKRRKNKSKQSKNFIKVKLYFCCLFNTFKCKNDFNIKRGKMTGGTKRRLLYSTLDLNGSGNPPCGIPMYPCRNSTTDCGKDNSSALSSTSALVRLFWTMNWARSPTILDDGVTWGQKTQWVNWVGFLTWFCNHKEALIIMMALKIWELSGSENQLSVLNLAFISLVYDWSSLNLTITWVSLILGLYRRHCCHFKQFNIPFCRK